MSDDIKIRKWGRGDKALLWAIAFLVFLNFIIGILALGPDILSW